MARFRRFERSAPRIVSKSVAVQRIGRKVFLWPLLAGQTSILQAAVFGISDELP